MKSEVSSQKSIVSSRRSRVGSRKLVFFCLLSSVFCLLSCSIPNLEPAECTEARETLREFYSSYFGGNQPFAAENLKQYEKYLSGEFSQQLRAEKSTNDPFTLTGDPPKAFRVGSCQVTEAGKKADFQIVFFWKSDTRSEQREIRAEAVKENDKWLINRIYNDNQK